MKKLMTTTAFLWAAFSLIRVLYVLKFMFGTPENQQYTLPFMCLYILIDVFFSAGILFFMLWVRSEKV